MRILLTLLALVAVVGITTLLNVWHANILFHEDRITRRERDEMVNHPMPGLCLVELVSWLALSQWLITVFA